MMHDVPVVSDYLRKETVRDVDKAVRLQLAEALESVRSEIEAEERILVENGGLAHLSAVGRLRAKLDKLVNLIKYASRGYRGLFDTYRLTASKLDRLHRFDEALTDEIESLHWKVESLHAARERGEAIGDAIKQLDRALDAVEKAFAQRNRILLTEE